MRARRFTYPVMRTLPTAIVNDAKWWLLTMYAWRFVCYFGFEATRGKAVGAVDVRAGARNVLVRGEGVGMLANAIMERGGWSKE